MMGNVLSWQCILKRLSEWEMHHPSPFIPVGTKHKTKIRQKLSLPDKTTIGMKITIALLSQDKGILSFWKRLSEEINLTEMYDIWCTGNSRLWWKGERVSFDFSYLERDVVDVLNLCWGDRVLLIQHFD